MNENPYNGWQEIIKKRQEELQLREKEKEYYFPAVAVIGSILAGMLGLIFFMATTIHADEINLDKWADAIRQAEGNPNYGIISISCDNEEKCRKYCKNTIYNTLVKYRKERCKNGEADIDCLARRYAPINSDTDNGTNKFWKNNVKWFLEHPGRK